MVENYLFLGGLFRAPDQSQINRFLIVFIGSFKKARSFLLGKLKFFKLRLTTMVDYSEIVEYYKLSTEKSGKIPN